MNNPMATAHLTDERVREWSDLTADSNPLHTDTAFAANTNFGVPIVQGHYLVAWALEHVPAIHTSQAEEPFSMRFRFIAPVPVGATVALTETDIGYTITTGDGTESVRITFDENPQQGAA